MIKESRKEQNDLRNLSLMCFFTHQREISPIVDSKEKYSKTCQTLLSESGKNERQAKYCRKLMYVKEKKRMCENSIGNIVEIDNKNDKTY